MVVYNIEAAYKNMYGIWLLWYINIYFDKNKTDLLKYIILKRELQLVKTV